VRTPILLALLATTTLAGCTTTGGNPTPATNTTAASTSAAGDTTPNGAPKVTTPLDFTEAAAAPCTLLDAAQLQALGMTGVAGEDNSSPLGPACIWSGTSGASGQSVGFSFVTGDGGLDYLYQMRNSYDLFEPQPPIQGQPALLNEPLDARKDGECSVVVGLTDKQILTTTVLMRTGANPAPKFNDPCGVATQAAGLALTTIKGGS
jgi:Protein of unknown function (DUF3558)